MKRVVYTCLVACFSGCNPSNHHDPVTVVDAAPEASVAIEVVADASPAPTETWQDAMREERWSDALALMGPLKSDDSAQAKFARARAAVESADTAQALAAMEGLEVALPLLSLDIARLRARAKATSGPFAEAGDWFASKPSAADQLDAARAYEKAKDASKARSSVARVIAANKHRTLTSFERRQEADARAVRLRVRSAIDGDAIADAKWLYLHAPDLAAAADATPVIDTSHARFTSAELIGRANVLADATMLDEAVKTLDEALGNAPRDQYRHEKAVLLMRARGGYTQAASLFFEVYKSTSHADDLVSSARALSRDNKDDDAIARYDAAVKLSVHSPQADDASFLAARLVMLHGRWADACKRLDDYVANYSHEKKEASRLRAIAHWENGDTKLARKLLEEAAGAEADPIASARLSVLSAAAAYADGDKVHAIARWTEIAHSFPLTWPALTARAHLLAVAAPLPTMIDPDASATSAAMTVVLPPPVGTLHEVGLDDDAEVALRARETGVSSAWPTRSDEGLCRAYGQIDRAQRRFQISNTVPKVTLANAPSDATRWAWECVYPAPFSRLISRLEHDEMLPTGLVHAVMRQESGFDADAVSPARAIGLMQLLPETATSIALEIWGKPVTGDDLAVPSVNIRFGARYLRNVLARVRSVPLAVASYNAGPDAIQRWTTGMSPASLSHIELDAFVEAIPFLETRGYVAKVMGSMARYGYLAHGEEGVPKIDLPLP